MLKIDRLVRCWGKTNRSVSDPQTFHPALYHMLDVGYVAKSLLDTPTGSRWKQAIVRALGCNSKVISDWLPFFIALHDIGKISASFQRVIPQQLLRLTDEGFSFGRPNALMHNQVGENFIWFEWPQEEKYTIPDEFRKVIREMAGGHHGQFASPGALADIRKSIRLEEPPEWVYLRQQTMKILAELFLQITPDVPAEVSNISAALMQLTGFTTLCDWIGSDQGYFKSYPNINFVKYLVISQNAASAAIKADGFVVDTLSAAPTQFSSLFSRIIPRPLQLAIDDIPAAYLIEPALVVIEAPTGEGKTEAALALAHRIGKMRGSDEFYYALPTTATSNQMFLRVQKYLREQLGLKTGAKLIHGQAFLMTDSLDIQPGQNGNGTDEDLAVIDWFSSKKRALLAPFGVGTVDQIELGALNVRHASLRLAGLAGKVIIIDEVHAYDTYMTTIILRLLKWLHSLGSSVILLSATLPTSRRAELMSVYTEENLQATENNFEYPLILLGSSKGLYRCSPTTSQPNRKIKLNKLNFREDQPTQKAEWLIQQVDKGGCVCWITNTVNRAQEIYKEVKRLSDPGTELLLFHARFPLVQRQEIETSLVGMLGPDKSKRPARSIVIGTQVLEQSLDLDFDLMVSDLAPIDLLLQRSGRLHRHTQTLRSSKLRIPTLHVNVPINDDGKLVISTDNYVYDEFLLRQTWEVLHDKDTLQLPDDFRNLVQAVYETSPDDISDNSQKAFNALKKKEELAREEATLRMLPEPDPEELFTGKIRFVYEESETKSAWIVTQTRLSEPSLNIIPLEDLGSSVMLHGYDKPVNKDLPAQKDVQLKMLRQQIRISHREVIEYLQMNKGTLSPLFAKSALLKDYLPLWLKEGQAHFPIKNGMITLRLDKELGLLIERKGGK